MFVDYKKRFGKIIMSHSTN